MAARFIIWQISGPNIGQLLNLYNFLQYEDISKTVTHRHQFWLCHQVQLNPNILTPQLEVSPKQLSRTLSCEDRYLQLELKHIFPSLTDDSVVNHPDWADIQSSHFYMYY